MLSQLIRFYGNSYQSALSDYLGKSLDFFVQQQKSFQKNFTDAMNHNPLNTVSDLTEQNIQMWQQIQDNFFKAAGFTGPDDKKQK